MNLSKKLLLGAVAALALTQTTGCVAIIYMAERWWNEQPLTNVSQKVENNQSSPKTVQIAAERVTPESSLYAVCGRVRYEKVEGTAYLEMWNKLPDGSQYFSRALGDSRVPDKITGSSKWRDFELPFNLMDKRPAYVDLVINVVMPGKGLIEVSPMAFVDLPGLDTTGTWSTGSTVGLWGIACVGALAGIFGTICGRLVSRGKGRRFVLGIMIFGAVLGGILLVAGGYALAVGQPWQPLWLGGLLLILFPLVYRSVKRHYAQVELRKMQARDA